VEGYTWQPVPETVGRQWQLQQWELTPNAQAPAVPGATTGTGNTGVPGVPSLPDYSQIDAMIAQINATNQAAQHAANAARVPGGTEQENAASQYNLGLFADANDPNRMYASVMTDAAEQAIASGTAGSVFAGTTGLYLNEEERIRRGQLAQGNLTAQTARNPAAPIADTQALLTLLQQQGFTASQADAERALARWRAQLDAQTALAVAGFRNSGVRGPSYPSSGGGGSRTAPALPTDYRSNIPNPPPYTAGGTGTGSAFSFVPPDNWDILTPQQQGQYATGVGNNPYYGLPDWMNPYSGDEQGGAAAPAPQFEPLPNFG